MTAAFLALEIASTPALLTAAGVLLLAILILTSIPRSSGRREAKRRTPELEQHPLAHPMGPTGEDSPTWARTEEDAEEGTGDESTRIEPVDISNTMFEAAGEPVADEPIASDEPVVDPAGVAPPVEGPPVEELRATTPQDTAETHNATASDATEGGSAVELPAEPTPAVPARAVLFSEATIAAALAAAHPPVPTVAPHTGGVVGDDDTPEIPRWDGTWWEQTSPSNSATTAEAGEGGTTTGTELDVVGPVTPPPAPDYAPADVWTQLPDVSELAARDGEGPFPPNDQPDATPDPEPRRGLWSRLFRRNRPATLDIDEVEDNATGPHDPQLGPVTQLENSDTTPEDLSTADADEALVGDTNVEEPRTADAAATDWQPQMTPPPYIPPTDVEDAASWDDTHPDTAPPLDPAQLLEADTDPIDGESVMPTGTPEVDASPVPKPSWWMRLFGTNTTAANTDAEGAVPVDTEDAEVDTRDAAPVLGPEPTVADRLEVDDHPGAPTTEPAPTYGPDTPATAWEPQLDAAGQTTIDDDTGTVPDADTDAGAELDAGDGDIAQDDATVEAAHDRRTWLDRLLGRSAPRLSGEEEEIPAVPVFGPAADHSENDASATVTEQPEEVAVDAPAANLQERSVEPTLALPELDEDEFTPAAPRRLSLRARLSSQAAARRAKRLGYFNDDTPEPEEVEDVEVDVAPDDDVEEVQFVDPTSWGIATVLDDDEEEIDPTSMRGAFQLSRRAEREAERAARRAKRDSDTTKEAQPETPQLAEHEMIDWEALGLPEPIPAPAAVPTRPWS